VGCAEEAQNMTFGTTRAGLICSAVLAGALAERRGRQRPIVTVSLTFDDTEDEQLDAAAVIEAHGRVGTFM
jgi:hypothetical protein